MSREHKIVEAAFETRERLAEALISDVDDGGVFVAGDHPLGAGQQVHVMVRVSDIEPGILMAGAVLWRRIVRGMHAPPGVGIRFEPTERSRFAFLQGIATGGAAVGRRTCRYPVTIPIAYVLARDTALRAGTLLDISEAGARMQATPAPAHGQLIVVRLRDGRSGPPLPLEIIWTQAESAGLGLVADRAEVRRFWGRMVETARADIDARLVRGGV